MSDTVKERLGYRIPGHAQCLPATNTGQAASAHNEQKSQGPYAAQGVGIDPFAGAALWGGQGLKLKTAHQVVRKDVDMLSGAVGPIGVGGDHIEGKLPFEFGQGLFLSPAPGHELPQGWSAQRLVVVMAEYSKCPSSGENRSS